ncbi:hypothetical protein F4818DRAFT_270598 [Hypoxylon cercidicola]|nr:hypothetical protein F4818DRAFT_270598 [Hypoxylon cercidicola]
MDPKKTFATTDTDSVDAASFDLDPPVGRRARAHRTLSLTSRRRSQSSLRSESSPPTPSPCATREIPGEDCALQRFIVWAAVKRNKSTRMAAGDRLKCPLLLCGQQFDDHESMLRHLTKCQHLKTGEYVCYECMKIERFNDGKCRGCVGHRTKRRRIINMARNFFSNIGNRSRRGSPSGFQDDVSMPPPSYDSLVIDLEEQSQRQPEQQRQQQQQQVEDERPQHPPQPQIELNGREIHELDSRQMLPTAELDPINYDTPRVGVPLTSDQHNATSEVMTRPQVVMFSQYASSRTRPHDNDSSMPPPNLMSPNSGPRRPSLALDTHVDHCRNVPRTKHLSPSSSLRSTKSSQNVSPITPWSSTSGGSGAWTMCSSVDTTMTSPMTPFGPNESSSISQPEGILATEKATTGCPDDDCNYMIDNMSELPGDNPLSIPRGLSDPLDFCFDPKDNYSWMQSVCTELSLGTSVNMMFTDTNSKPSNMPSGYLEPSDRAPEVRALIESAWVALQTHVASSLSKLSPVEGNSLVDRLRDQSPKAVALKGLSSFKRILQGNDLADPLDYICFVHLIYAFSLIIHEDELVTRCNILYRQALAYRRFLDSACLEDYTQIVTMIWQSAAEDQSRTQLGDASLSGSSSNYKGKEPEFQADTGINIGTDPLVAVGQNFLDDIENSVITSGSQKPVEDLAFDLWSTHAVEFDSDSLNNGAFTVTVDYIVQFLSQKFYDSEILSVKLRGVGQRVRAGYITTVRKLELAILQAGKNTLESSKLFDEFIPEVRRLCEPIYSKQGFHSRMGYQSLGVSLVEAVIESIASDPQHAQEEPVTYPLGLGDTYNDEDDFLSKLHETFPGPDDPSGIDHEFLIDLDPNASQQNQTDLTTARNFPMIDPGSFRGIGPSAQGPATGPKSFTTTTTSRTGTPSESYAASPDISRQRVIPTPNPSTPGQAEASPMPTSSMGQKVEAIDACNLCGYRPKGDPQWFKGSMAKHKKMQHSTDPPIIYKCPFPGCSSQYKNRQDNLRQHQIEKNHFVGDEAGRRPSKRKKM